MFKVYRKIRFLSSGFGEILGRKIPHTKALRHGVKRRLEEGDTPYGGCFLMKIYLY